MFNKKIEYNYFVVIETILKMLIKDFLLAGMLVFFVRNELYGT